MLKERIKDFADSLSSEDQADLAEYLHKQDQKAYDAETLAIVEQRSKELQDGTVEWVPFEEMMENIRASRKKS